MTEGHHEIALLIADISGSTPLYDKLGNETAYRIVGDCLQGLRDILRAEGGKFIRSKGDDVLGAFTYASNALRAARNMQVQQANSQLAIHIGIHFGHIINLNTDVYGDTVNMTARLASLAKSGEILASEEFIAKLSESEKLGFQPLDNITFKGKSSPTSVFTLLGQDEEARTKVILNRPNLSDTKIEQQGKKATLIHHQKKHTCIEGDSLVIGRTVECDVVLTKPWISRQHARIHLRHGRIELEDQSSSGTYVSTQDGYEFFLHRENVLLTGSGRISPVLKPDNDEAEIIQYRVD